MEAHVIAAQASATPRWAVVAIVAYQPHAVAERQIAETLPLLQRFKPTACRQKGYGRATSTFPTFISTRSK
jgi:hypothetical protein